MIHRVHIRPALRSLSVTSVVLFASCATNPATGERQLVLIGEGQEIQMGLEADGGIVASLGLYDDPSLQAYLQSLGARMAAVSERPSLPWTFRVVDDPVVNAFAVPGGFIYITRGIMAHFNSEAQLAAVVGHEIGHVTARHSVEQMSRAQLAQVGLVAAILAPEQFQRFGGLAGASMQLLFLKFGRDDERQADDLGLRYVRRLEYDPRPMVDVFRLLDRVSPGKGGGRVPEWLSTHPSPAGRAERIEEAIAGLRDDFAGHVTGEASYLSRLDGMVYGEDPRQGFFEEARFLHPELRFEIQFPSGWQTANQRQAVLAASPDQDAMVQLTIAQESTPEDAAGAFFAQQGVTGDQPRRTQINRLPAVTAGFQAVTEQGTLVGTVAFVGLGNNTYQLLGYGTTSGWSRHRSDAIRSMESFDRLTDRAALGVQPYRIRIETLDRGMLFREFVRRYPSDLPLVDLALINQVEPTTALKAGARLKRVTR